MWETVTFETYENKNLLRKKGKKNQQLYFSQFSRFTKRERAQLKSTAEQKPQVTKTSISRCVFYVSLDFSSLSSSSSF